MIMMIRSAVSVSTNLCRHRCTSFPSQRKERFLQVASPATNTEFVCLCKLASQLARVFLRLCSSFHGAMTSTFSSQNLEAALDVFVQLENCECDEQVFARHCNHPMSRREDNLRCHCSDPQASHLRAPSVADSCESCGSCCSLETACFQTASTSCRRWALHRCATWFRRWRGRQLIASPVPLARDV